MTGCVRLLGLGNGSSGRPFGAFEAERPQLVVDDIGPDLAVRSLHPLFDLGQVLIDELGPPGRLG